MKNNNHGDVNERLEEQGLLVHAGNGARTAERIPAAGGSPSADPLPMQLDFIPLRTLNEGLLNPWVAPALRGMVLKPLRDHFCKLMGGRQAASPHGASSGASPVGKRPAAGGQEDAYCLGCVKNGRCDYGRVFEPDLRIIDPAAIQRGAREGLRGITIGTAPLDRDRSAPPSPPLAGKASGPPERIQAPAGTLILARVLSIGEPSISLARIVVEALDAVGRENGLGDRQRVRFMVDPTGCSSVPWELCPERLPTSLGVGSVPWVKLELETPLSLKRAGSRETQRDGSVRFGQRRFARESTPEPTFADFLSNSVRTVRRAVNEFRDPGFCSELHLGNFVGAAAAVATDSSNLDYFAQNRVSHRQLGHHKQSGWLGSLVFRDVPLCYLPWLVWGGRLGVGDSRNCGAGLWHVVLA